jgi:hypothetical protein
MELGDSELVLKAAFEASDILNRGMEAVRDSVSEDEFQKLQLSFGKVLGSILFELIDPMVDLHPTLKAGNSINDWTALATSVGARKPENWQ